MAFGDQIAQNLVEKRSFNKLDFIRTAKFAGIGFFIAVKKIVIYLIWQYFNWIYKKIYP